jgi:hypothetical protein
MIDYAEGVRLDLLPNRRLRLSTCAKEASTILEQLTKQLTLLCIALTSILSAGCFEDNKARLLRQGGESVDQHAKEIEKAAHPD